MKAREHLVRVGRGLARDAEPHRALDRRPWSRERVERALERARCLRGTVGRGQRMPETDERTERVHVVVTMDDA